MAATLTTVPQMSNAEATTASNTKNAFYVANELDGLIVSKIGQTDAWFATSMPLAREAEYDAGNDTVKSKFAIVGALANIKQSPTKTFLVAWEEQYTVIFG